MPAFLTDTRNQCCCAEMRCCTPETVVVTADGFAGAIVAPFTAGYFSEKELKPAPVGGLIIGWMGGHAAIFQLGRALNECHPRGYPDGAKWDAALGEYVYDERGMFIPTCSIMWPSICFPQQDYQCGDNPGPNACACYPSAPFAIGAVYIASRFTTNAQWAEACSHPGAQEMCEEPGESRLRFGPNNGRVCDTDINGSWICYRQDGPLRPELVAKVNRSLPSTPNMVDARLLFDVFPRRRWMTDPYCNDIEINNLTCLPADPVPDPPPEGCMYCIDYRCGPRNPGRDEGNDGCGRWQCNAPEGFVWPHLKAYPEGDNNSSTLKLRLDVAQYYSMIPDGSPVDNSAFPFSWRVGAVTVTTPGSGYAVGDFFLVDFDDAWWSINADGGQQWIGFPDAPAPCYLPVEWADKYGATQDSIAMNLGLPFGAKAPLQRLRVSEVDKDGGIVAVEIVPWFQNPEYNKATCIDTLPNHKRTPFYPEYNRVLCHPRSVDIGGEGYALGDTITFSCGDPECSTYAAAVATVVDVDDNGSVLDWFVSGTDIYNMGYGGGRMPCWTEGQADERGSYHFEGKSLCDLVWSGIGNPVRSVAYSYDGFSGGESMVNTSRLTSVSVNITKSPCRTTVSAFVAAYRYTSFSFLTSTEGFSIDTLIAFSPYPKCVAGGAVLRPIFGLDGANDSEIGGPIASVEVDVGGAGYAFIDKRHIEPILPTSVPDIGDGTGAVLKDFAFDTVDNFPRPGFAEGEPYQPASDRFSYFPVASVAVDVPGTGYEVGQEFEVAPVGGTGYSMAWQAGGADDPTACPNGGWYGGRWASTLNEVGHSVFDGSLTRQSKCTLRITEVDATGGIQGLEVVHGGMMFRCVMADGVRHPEVFGVVGSDTGSGAKVALTINTDKTSSDFGAVTTAQVVQMPVEEQADPLHSTPDNPVPFPLGGREYADPPGGWMWELGNIIAGAESFGAGMIAKFNMRGWVHDPFNTDNSSHTLIEGSLPPYVRRSTTCHIGECYHSLLNRTYPLMRWWTGDREQVEYRVWELRNYGNCDINSFCPVPYPGTSSIPSGRPLTPYGIFVKKGKQIEAFQEPDEVGYCANEIENPPLPIARATDYVIVEWGMNVTLSAALPGTAGCPDHSNGRTNR